MTHKGALTLMDKMAWDQFISTSNQVVTNARHLEALQKTNEHIHAIQQGIQDQVSNDLVSQDIRMALYYLGQITGEVDVDKDILGTIFGKFCIGK